LEDVLDVGNSFVFYVADLVIYLLSILVLFSSIFCIRAKYPISKKQILIFKPLTLILIILIAIIFPTIDLKYKIIIVSGLLFSLLGDTYLIYPEKYFKKGLIAFLLGHICYIIAFIVSSGTHFTLYIFFPITIIGFLYLRSIMPYSGKMKIPIIIYVIIIAIMGWAAMERLNSLHTVGSLIAVLGAVLFMISDGVLALNKFKKPFYSAELIILATYFSAQWLLAVSVIVV
jgi:uncharacterized membrane protein YhhN